MSTMSHDPVAPHDLGKHLVSFRRDQEWMSGCEAAIRQGGDRLAQCLSNYRVAVPEERHWASIGNYIAGSEAKAPRRLAMIRAWLDHPSRPQISAHNANHLLSVAIDRRSHEIIPLLSEAGFALTEDSRAPYLVAKQLKVGRWPHPDLICPWITSLVDAHNDLTDAVIAPNALRHPKHAARLVTLECHPELTRKISRLLAHVSADMDKKKEKERAAALLGFTELALGGWLDMDQMAAHLIELGRDPSATHLFADMEASLLDRRSAAAPVARSTPRARRL